MASKESIIVNSFMFCQDHGDELCFICCCDHRMRNNIQIEDALAELTECLVFEVEERLSRNAYAVGAVAAVDTEESYRCERHKTIDCPQCFNWVELISQEAETKEEQGGWLSEGHVLASALAVQGLSVT